MTNTEIIKQHEMVIKYMSKVYAHWMIVYLQNPVKKCFTALLFSQN